jgi:hypothetical protein
MKLTSCVVSKMTTWELVHLLSGSQGPPVCGSARRERFGGACWGWVPCRGVGCAPCMLHLLLINVFLLRQHLSGVVGKFYLSFHRPMISPTYN